MDSTSPNQTAETTQILNSSTQQFNNFSRLSGWLFTAGGFAIGIARKSLTFLIEFGCYLPEKSSLGNE